MNGRILATAVLVVSSVFASEAVYAAPATLPLGVHAFFAKTKMVSFALRNETGVPLKLKAGDDVMTLEVGKTINLKLPAGSSVTAEEATKNHAAGSLITQVSHDLSGATIAVR